MNTPPLLTSLDRAAAFAARRALALALLFGAAAGLIFIGAKDLHLDEAASWAIAADTSLLWHKLWNFEGNMWLYYWLLSVWLPFFGSSEAAMRGLSVFFALLGVAAAFYLAKETGGRRLAAMTVFMLPIHTLFVRNAQYARGYSLVMLLSTLLTYLVLLYTRTGKRVFLISYAIIGACAVYTHMYAVFVIAAHGIFVLSTWNARRVVPFIGACVVLGAGVVPLFASPAMGSGQINWISPPGFAELAATFSLLSGDLVVSAAFIAGLIAWQFWRSGWRMIKNDGYRLLLLSVLAPVVCALVVSYLVRPIYSVQYLTVSLVPFVILACSALSAVPKKTLRRVAFIAAAALFTARLSFWYSGGEAPFMALANSNAPWKSVAAEVNRAPSAEDGVLIYPPYTHIVYDYYLKQLEQGSGAGKTLLTSIPLQPSRLAAGRETPYNNALVSEIPDRYKNVWYIYNKRGGTESSPRKKELDEMLRKSYTPQRTYSLYEMEVTQYMRVASTKETTAR